MSIPGTLSHLILIVNTETLKVKKRDARGSTGWFGVVTHAHIIIIAYVCAEARTSTH